MLPARSNRNMGLLEGRTSLMVAPPGKSTFRYWHQLRLLSPNPPKGCGHGDVGRDEGRDKLMVRVDLEGFDGFMVLGRPTKGGLTSRGSGDGTEQRSIYRRKQSRTGLKRLRGDLRLSRGPRP